MRLLDNQTVDRLEQKHYYLEKSEEEDQKERLQILKDEKQVIEQTRRVFKRHYSFSLACAFTKFLEADLEAQAELLGSDYVSENKKISRKQFTRRLFNRLGLIETETVIDKGHYTQGTVVEALCGKKQRKLAIKKIPLEESENDDDGDSPAQATSKKKHKKPDSGLSSSLSEVFHRKANYQPKANMRRYLENEIEVVKDMRHENIVRFKQYFRIRSMVYVVMQHGGEETLSRLVYSRSAGYSSLTLDNIKDWTCQLLCALSYLQHNNIVHHDVKPSNITIRDVNKVAGRKCFGQRRYDDTRLMLVDFNFSVKVNNFNQLIKVFAGSRCYKPPEVLSRKPHIGHLVDVWATGAVVASIFRQTDIFSNYDTYETLSRAVHRDRLAATLNLKSSPYLSRLSVENTEYGRSNHSNNNRYYPKKSELNFTTELSNWSHLLSKMLDAVAVYRLKSSELLQLTFFSDCKHTKQYIDQYAFF